MSQLLLIALAIGAVLFAVFTVMVVLHRRYVRSQFRSRATKVWRRGAGESRQIGPLLVREHQGEREEAPAVMLLHGLAASGAYWGAVWDTLGEHASSVIVPDLLGFAGSLDRERPAHEHSFEHHVASLRGVIDDAGHAESGVVLVGHSLGAQLALRVAREAGDQVNGVVLFAPPLHDSYEDAELHVALRGRFARWFACDRRGSQILCKTICTRPRVAFRVAQLGSPNLPIDITRDTIRHTWNSYIGTYRGLFGDRGWRDDVDDLAARGIPVVIAYGDRDHTLELRHVMEAVERSEAVLEVVAGAGHQAPLTSPEACVRLVREHLERIAARDREQRVADARR